MFRKYFMILTAICGISAALPGTAMADSKAPPEYKLEFSVMSGERFLTGGSLKGYKIADITYEGDEERYSFAEGVTLPPQVTPEILAEKADGTQDQAGLALAVQRALLEEEGGVMEYVFPYGEEEDVDGFGFYLITQGDAIPPGYEKVPPFFIRLAREDRMQIGTKEVYKRTSYPKQIPAPHGDDGKDPEDPPKDKKDPKQPVNEPSGTDTSGDSGLPSGSVKGVGRQMGEALAANIMMDADRLPQTGQLWWPVPILAGFGIIFITAGCISMRRQ